MKTKVKISLMALFAFLLFACTEEQRHFINANFSLEYGLNYGLGLYITTYIDIILLK